MWHLSVPLALPYWPCLVDKTARAHSVNTPVVMVVVVMTGDAIVAGTVRARVPGPCPTSSGAIGSAARSSGLPSMDWLCGWGTSGASLLQDSWSLGTFVLSSVRSSVQLAPEGRG